MYDKNDNRWYSILRFNEDGTGIYVEKHVPDAMTYTLNLSTMDILMRITDWDNQLRMHIVSISEEELILETYYKQWDGEKEIEVPEEQHYYRYSGPIPADD